MEKAGVKTILIVDENSAAREKLVAEFRGNKGFDLACADTAKQAALEVKTRRVDLLVTELNLPEVNGFQLLSYMKIHSPATRCIALCHHFPSKVKQRLEAQGIACLSKPLAPGALTRLVSPVPQGPSRNIQGISLTSFLQFVNRDKKNCTLSICSGHRQGTIDCLDGEVIAARTGSQTGAPAFYAIMAWEAPSIGVREGRVTARQEINIPLMHLLMTSHQAMDESGGSKQPGRVTDAPPVRPEEVSQLAGQLARQSGISGFQIFDSKDRPLNGGAGAPGLAPGQFLSMGQALNPMMGGQLKFVSIIRTDRTGVVMAQSGQNYFRADLKPGTQPGDIMK